MRRLLLACLCMTGLVHDAGANGRPANTSTISFKKGDPGYVLAGMTFGVLVSKDGGGRWDWMCEEAVGYGGMYDPDYAVSSTGAVFATTFDGLRVMRDGCSFGPTAFGTKFVSTTTVGADGTVYAGITDAKTDVNPGDARIYRSDDDGVTFPVALAGSPGVVNDWWESLEVSTMDPQRLYLTGYRFVPNPAGGSNIRVHILSRSENGGTVWTGLPVAVFGTMPNSTIGIAGISHANPDIVYVRVALADNALVDDLYRSTDKGVTFTKVLSKKGPMAVVVRANGDVIAGTPNDGTYRSTNGVDFTPVAGAPHIRCLVETPTGELWACTANFGTPQVPPDGFGIMKTTDLATWTGVLKFQNIHLPVACGTDTIQYQKCDHNPSVDIWCGMCQQFGCDAQRQCANGDVTELDGPPRTDPKGCCQSGPDAPAGALVLGSAVALVALRRRRRS
jgi:MYXO-CTERM domain-containing protein